MYTHSVLLLQALKFPHRAKEINGLVMATLSALEKVGQELSR